MWLIKMDIYFSEGQNIAYADTKKEGHLFFKSLGFKYNRKDDIYYREDIPNSMWGRIEKLPHVSKTTIMILDSQENAIELSKERKKL